VRRLRARSDEGTTLVELLVAVAVSAVVMLVVGMTLVSATRGTRLLEHTSEAVDEARLASARIDRELRSATCISSPAENTTGNMLAFDTVADGVPHHVTYAVDDDELVRREGGKEVVVVTPIGATAGAFRLVSTPLRTVEINLPVESANGGSFVLATTIAGRNAWRTCTT